MEFINNEEDIDNFLINLKDIVKYCSNYEKTTLKDDIIEALQGVMILRYLFPYELGLIYDIKIKKIIMLILNDFNYAKLSRSPNYT